MLVMDVQCSDTCNYGNGFFALHIRQWWSVML